MRAIAVRDGYFTSPVATQTFITDAPHTVRVVSLSTDDKYLFSDEMGMYTNGPQLSGSLPPRQSRTRCKLLDELGISRPRRGLGEADGTKLIDQDGSFKLNGQYSRALDQKSFAVHARSDNGNPSRFDAPLFSDRDYDSYKSFVLRCTGQDYNRARMRDAFITGMMKGRTSCIRKQRSACCT